MALDDEFEVKNGNPKFLCSGMYLGRCFLDGDQAVGEVWAQYKNHPSLFCTVQDDDFTIQFRELSPAYAELWLDDETKSSEVATSARLAPRVEGPPRSGEEVREKIVDRCLASWLAVGRRAGW